MFFLKLKTYIIRKLKYLRCFASVVKVLGKKCLFSGFKNIK